VTINAAQAVATSSTAIAFAPPRVASSSPATMGANGMISDEANLEAAATRPWSSSGVTFIR